MVKLSKRLSAVASFVNNGEIVADIGTDHGYIPAYLIDGGVCEKVYASDIKSGPLSKAVDTAKRFGVESKISFICADGLGGINKGDVNCIIIAGMGGETIAEILRSAPWATDKGMHLILQPQSKVSELYDFLRTRCKIEDARLVFDEGKLYQVLECYGGERADLSPEDIYFKNRDPLLRQYIDMAINKLENANEGLKKSTGHELQLENNNEIIRKYRELEGEISW